MEIAVGHRNRNGPFIEEYRPHIELAAVAYRKPHAILELLVCHCESEAPDIRAQQNLDGSGNMEREGSVHQHGLKLFGIDQSLTLPSAILVRFGHKAHPIHLPAAIILRLHQLEV